jgi:hypothetical protein
MDLDVYVGSLTRYYAGKWQTPLGQVREVVLAWRSELARALGEPLRWNEDPSAPCYTERVYFEPFACLQVLAAALDQGEADLDEEDVPGFPAQHPVWRAATKSDSPRFPHLYFPAMWLPCDFDPTITAKDPSGLRDSIGSSVWLLRELREINRCTDAGTKYSGEFGEAARFGLAVFIESAEKSVTRRLPMRLDL